MSTYFSTVSPIAYEGPTSDNPLSFKWYDKDRIVLGKRMDEQLRFAVCYWHSFCWNGLDPFGGDTFQRPWQLMADPMAGAKAKADVAFEFFAKLGAPYYCFHDRDIAPEGATPQDSVCQSPEVEAHYHPHAAEQELLAARYAQFRSLYRPT